MLIYLVARHYPPEISGGARRPSLMAGALRDRGHTVRVITPFDTLHPDDIRLVPLTSRSPTPRQPSPLKTSVARWTRWPDGEAPWARRVAERLGELNPPDWIITTSPPESSHHVGWAAKALWPETRWLAEFRDSWIDSSHREELGVPLRKAVESRLARRYLSRVDAVSAVSPVVMTDAAALVPDGTPSLVVSHFSDAPPAPYAFPDTEFTLLHSGGFSLSDRRRELRPILQALTPVVARRPELRLHLTGRLSEGEMDLCAHRDWVVVHGAQPLHVSRAMQAGADALLLTASPDSHALPGKFAEYALAGRPIIAMGVGPWRKLVPERARLLRPSALVELPHDQRVEIIDELNVTHAAERLEAFLEGVETSC